MIRREIRNAEQLAPEFAKQDVINVLEVAADVEGDDGARRQNADAVAGILGEIDVALAGSGRAVDGDFPIGDWAMGDAASSKLGFIGLGEQVAVTGKDVGVAA